MASLGSNQMHALLLKNVCKSFGGINAVKDVDLVVNVGESRALIGPNGAGKTTLYNLITGEIRLDRGEVYLFDRNLTHEPVRERIQLGMGRSYQISNLFQELTVRENLFLATWKRKKKPSSLFATLFRAWERFGDQHNHAFQVAQQVGLEKKIDVPVNELSHGEHRQLELGIILAHDPKIMLLDEPMAGLSASERSFMAQQIIGLKSKITIVIIEHDIDVAFSIADQVSVLHQGSIIAEGPPEEIRANPRVQEIYTLSRNSKGPRHA